MALDARLDKIPNFIKAKTVEGLRRFMLLNNMKHVMQFNYHDIQFVNGYWYAWFYESVDMGELANGDTNRSGQV
jgi:hypothetical protein